MTGIRSELGRRTHKVFMQIWIQKLCRHTLFAFSPCCRRWWRCSTLRRRFLFVFFSFLLKVILRKKAWKSFSGIHFVFFWKIRFLLKNSMTFFEELVPVFIRALVRYHSYFGQMKLFALLFFLSQRDYFTIWIRISAKPNVYINIRLRAHRQFNLKRNSKAI